MIAWASSHREPLSEEEQTVMLLSGLYDTYEISCPCTTSTFYRTEISATCEICGGRGYYKLFTRYGRRAT